MSTDEMKLVRVVVQGDEDTDSPVSVLRRAADVLSGRPDRRVIDMTFEYDIANLRWKGFLYFTQQ
ncbi:hypothetical protein ACFW2Y_30760 [Streptomyces sp. NPDC058877]|uniref:hypothetical protein n=1 Tax=unclassified Streptomyces TaxID=2593676 RepID=UPI0036B7CC8E